MSELPFHSSKRQEAAKRMAEDLRHFDTARGVGTTEDEEMISLLVEEAYKGIDISKRYPDLYQKLLGHPDLRQSFLDLLEAMDEEATALPIPWAEPEPVDLSFLDTESPQPQIEKLGDHWSIHWQRTIASLQDLFTPSELVYRSDPSLIEDPWFTLLREEISVEDLRYAIALECTFSGENEGALSSFLSIAVTVEQDAKQPPFPVQSSLQWGLYQQTIQIFEEGRSKFPDLPLSMIMDKDLRTLRSELYLTLEPLS